MSAASWSVRGLAHGHPSRVTHSLTDVEPGAPRRHARSDNFTEDDGAVPDAPAGRIRPGQNIVVEGKMVTVHGCKDWSNQTPIDLDGRRYVPAGKLCGGVDFAGRTVFVVRDSDGWRFAGDPSWSVKVPGERWAS